VTVSSFWERTKSGGDECPKYLLGDFAFAIWDEKRQRLFCARDHVGIKSFYYYLTEDTFIFGNDIRVLLQNSEIPKEINEKAIVNYLYDLEDQSQTFIKHIKPLKPAAILTVTSATVDTAEYWCAEDSEKIGYETESEYVDKLYSLLKDAVKARCRSIYPMSSHLSGGLDSSSIAVLAARELKKEHKKLHTFNWVFAPNAKIDDLDHHEWSLSREIAEREKMEHHYVSLTPEDLLHYYKTQNIAMNDKQYIWYEFIVRKEAAKKGVRTILSGWGGDELITNSGSALVAGYFGKGEVWKALRILWKESGVSPRPLRSFLGKCYHQLFTAYLPDKWYKRLRGMKQYEWDVLQCTTEGFHQRVGKISLPENIVLRKSVRENQLSRFYQGHLQNRIDSWQSSSFADRIEYRYPLLDKRIVEFALGIPEELFRKNGYGRYLFRKSTQRFLPDKVCWWNDKSEPVRVSKLFDLMKEANVRWSTSIDDKNAINSYINLDTLLSYIEKTEREWGETNEDIRLERLMITYRSIAVNEMMV